MNITCRRLIALMLALSLSLPILAQENGNGEAEEKDNKEKEEEKPKTFAELTEDAERFEGLFTLFRDPESGETHMLIEADQLDREYIYWIQVANGVVDAGYFKGAYGPSGIIKLRRHFDDIEIVEQNTSFYFDPDSALARASDANISDAVLAVQEIVAEDEKSGDVLIKADPVFASEALTQIKPTPNPDADPKTTFVLGKLDDDKTRILNVRSYPLNTDIEVEYVYHNDTPLVQGSAAVTDARNVSIRVMHSFIEIPESDYQPRPDDPRIGFFSGQVTDLTDDSAAPFRDHINRWHLVKKNPDAELSEPVEPITWWIENTTPAKWRELIRDAALEWNRPFEKIGFKNAIVVRQQPDDADWDAGDIRYNVLRWTSSPNPPFGGYGPSFTNPRTGQIIGADIMLEYSFMTRYLRTRGQIQDPTSWNHEPLQLATEFGGRYCTLGHGLQLNTVFAQAAAEAYGLSDELDQQLTHDTMHYLILHEMGHTLGMNHNMKATNLLTPDEAWDRQAVEERGLAGSVMDYPAINFAPTREKQTLYYMVAPGPYDDWFIEYGYSVPLDDPEAEEERLEEILSRSTEPQLAFGNDADDMRAPGAGIDPRVNIYDMTSDGILFASRQMAIMQATLDNLVNKYPEDGKSYQEVYEAVNVMFLLWGRSAAVTSRFVGGVYVDRAMVGQQGAEAPFVPVDEDTQRRAMQVLAEQVFGPTAVSLRPELLRHTAPRRRGFNHFGQTEDPKIHDTVLVIQRGILDHLLNPVVLKRVTDTALYGNTYTIGEMMNDLTDAVFLADASENVNSFRQNLQMEYVQRLAKMARANGNANGSGNPYHTPAVNMAVFSLNRIDDMLDQKRRVNVETQAHVQNLRLVIERALSADV